MALKGENSRHQIVNSFAFFMKKTKKAFRLWNAFMVSAKDGSLVEDVADAELCWPYIADAGGATERFAQQLRTAWCIDETHSEDWDAIGVNSDKIEREGLNTLPADAPFAIE